MLPKAPKSAQMPKQVFEGVSLILQKCYSRYHNMRTGAQGLRVGGRTIGLGTKINLIALVSKFFKTLYGTKLLYDPQIV